MAYQWEKLLPWKTMAASQMSTRALHRLRYIVPYEVYKWRRQNTAHEEYMKLISVSHHKQTLTRTELSGKVVIEIVLGSFVCLSYLQ